MFSEIGPVLVISFPWVKIRYKKPLAVRPKKEMRRKRIRKKNTMAIAKLFALRGNAKNNNSKKVGISCGLSVPKIYEKVTLLSSGFFVKLLPICRW